MKKKFGIGLFIAIILLFISSYIYYSCGLPDSFSLIRGNESTISLGFPFNLYIQGEKGIEINGRHAGENFLKLNPGSPLTLKSNKVGRVSLDLKFFGIIPFRTITVNVLPEVRVYPGGHSIGVRVRSRGIMVIGVSSVEAPDGHRYYPARGAGISVGDVITSINNNIVNDKLSLSRLIQKLAEKSGVLKIELRDRHNNLKIAQVRPIKNKDGRYMIGLYVEDRVAGVGTLSFYEPESGEYGALGHEIMELNSQTRIDIREGQIVNARISGINTGRKGLPGEKLGTFFQEDQILGEIVKNTSYGIYGILNKMPENPYFKKPICVASISEVKEGPASIYTVVEGGDIEEFKIDINRVYQQAYQRDKGIVLTITDQRLRNSTGGIVQGMSGSPIVQNNKLVGAVTHVFVNEPTRGYGVFAQWMLQQTDFYNNKLGKITEKTQENKRADKYRPAA